MCSFCNSEVETLKHLFWDCEFVKIFWQQVFTHCQKKLSNLAEFNMCEVLLGDKHLKQCIISFLFWVQKL